MSDVRYVAHRFGRAYGPDNSRRALAGALAKPVYGLETDCCVTADDDIVLLHDTYLPMVSTLSGWVHERTLDEIRAGRVRDHSGVVTDQRPLRLAEALAAISGVSLLQLEVKATTDEPLAIRTAEVLCDRLDGARLPEGIGLEVISFWPAACEVAAARGHATRLIIACAYLPREFAAWAVDRGVTGVILEGHYWSRSVVEPWREAGLSIASGLVNDRWLLERVLDFCPDAISTDRPHELSAELGR